MKRMIISGGSRGLGAALVDEYRRAGYEITELSRSGRSGDSVQVDLTQPKAAQQILDDEFGRIAADPCEHVLLFNNAGDVMPVGQVAHKAVDTVLGNVNVNFVGAIVLLRAFMLAFQAKNCPKAIVNISSGAALSGVEGWSLYCAAKAGIEHFIRTIALEQANNPFPINAFNISPGLIDTGMQASIRSAAQTDFPRVQDFVGFKAEGALRSPALVAGAVVAILASDPAPGTRHEVADYVP